MKLKINMVGGGFQHDICSSAGAVPEHIEWVKDKSSNISIHIDWDIFNVTYEDKNKLKYAWLAESSAIINQLIEKVKINIDFINENYELIFTHDKRLLGLSTKMRFVIPNAVPWVKDRKVFRKIKLVSMIASAKNMCPGHQYRIEWIQKLIGKVDLYGNGHNPIPHKEIGLKLYNFSIAMENDNYPSIFCEKITDCFAMGTIPIYWGSPDIGEFFNENGIIRLTDDFNVNDLSVDLYQSKLEYVKENFERAISLPTSEDYIYLNYIK